MLKTSPDFKATYAYPVTSLYESVENAIRNKVIVLYTPTLSDLSDRTPHYGVKRNGKPVRWILRPTVDSSIR